MTPREKICKWHYTKTWPSGKSLPYEYEDAVVVMSIPANYNLALWLGLPSNRVWELTRLWAPPAHRKNLLTEAIAFAVRGFSTLHLADALISYADPNVGHRGGVYRAASWVYLGQSEETRAYRGAEGAIIPRRAFHSGKSFSKKSEIIALGYTEVKLPGKFRFARGITRQGKKAVALKRFELSPVEPEFML